MKPSSGVQAGSAPFGRFGSGVAKGSVGVSVFRVLALGFRVFSLRSAPFAGLRGLVGFGF